jgi:hypothetical protein
LAGGAGDPARKQNRRANAALWGSIFAGIKFVERATQVANDVDLGDGGAWNMDR